MPLIPAPAPLDATLGGTVSDTRSPRSLPPRFDLDWIRARLGVHQPRELPLGEPLDAVVSPRVPGAVLRKRAAVATILRSGGEGPEVLLIRRAEQPGDPWSGHMAFPGGREEAQDTSLLGTAMRETREEIGWDLERQARHIGRLDDLPAIARGKPTGLLIAPFVFELADAPPPVPNHEVAEALWAPLSPLMRGERAAKMPYKVGETTLQLPAHDVDGRVVWGLTYAMLERLFELLRAP